MATRDKVLAIFENAARELRLLVPQSPIEAADLLYERGGRFRVIPSDDAAITALAHYEFEWLVSEGQVALWDRLAKGE